MLIIAQEAGPLGYRGVPASCISGISHPKVSSLPSGGSRIVAVARNPRRLTALSPPARRRIHKDIPSIALNVLLPRLNPRVSALEKIRWILSREKGSYDR